MDVGSRSCATHRQWTFAVRNSRLRRRAAANRLRLDFEMRGLPASLAAAAESRALAGRRAPLATTRLALRRRRTSIMNEFDWGAEVTDAWGFAMLRPHKLVGGRPRHRQKLRNSPPL